METNKTRQHSMFSFVVKMSPQLSVLPRPLPSTKRSINVEASNRLIAAVKRLNSKSHSRASAIIQ